MGINLKGIFRRGKSPGNPAFMAAPDIRRNLRKCISPQLGVISNRFFNSFVLAYEGSQTAYGLSFNFKLSLGINNGRPALYYPKFDKTLLFKDPESRAKLQSLKLALTKALKTFLFNNRIGLEVHYNDQRTMLIVNEVVTEWTKSVEENLRLIGLEIADVQFSGGNTQFTMDLARAKSLGKSYIEFLEENFLRAHENMIAKYKLTDIIVLYRFRP